MQKHIVVDGQQRIRACLEFLEGKVELDPKQSPDFADLTFDELRDEEKQKIYEYRFVVRLLPKTPDPVLRDIFQRLNRNNVALNAQELRQATYWGPFIQSMNGLSNQEYWSDAGLFTPNDIRRMMDVEFISELAVAMLHGLQNKKQSLDKWYTAYEKDFEQQLYVEAVFAKVLGELSQLLPNIHRTRWRKKSDFYTLFFVVAAHEQSLPLASDQRHLASEKLNRFQEQVTEYIRQTAPRSASETDESDLEAIGNPTEEPLGPGHSQYPIDVVQYAAAVQRAASDLANRRIRARQLESILADVWNARKLGSRRRAKTGVE
jgi:murein L,D-transpeptidase YcbB/YkuD